MRTGSGKRTELGAVSWRAHAEREWERDVKRLSGRDSKCKMQSILLYITFHTLMILCPRSKQIMETGCGVLAHLSPPHKHAQTHTHGLKVIHTNAMHKDVDKEIEMIILLMLQISFQKYKDLKVCACNLLMYCANYEIKKK